VPGLCLALAAFTLACGSAAEPTGPTRTYQLAQTGLGLAPDGTLWHTPANLPTDVDVVAVVPDGFGIPWDAFEAGSAPPAPWTALIDQLVAQVVALRKDVFLSLALVDDNGRGRQNLARRAQVVNGALQIVPGWAPPCYDFATAREGPARRAAYARYVEFMVRRFAPRYVNVAMEINLFLTCESGWEGLVEVERAAYDAAKAARPEVIAFPSIQLEQLYGYIPVGSCREGSLDRCFEAHYARLSGLRRDRFAISTYPHGLPQLGGVAGIPADWFTRASSRGRERAVFAETGWLSDPPRVRNGETCLEPFGTTDLNETGARTYLDRVLNAAEAGGMDLVTLFSNRDVVPAELMTSCECRIDPAWCALVTAFRTRAGTDPFAQAAGELQLKAFGTMGIRRHDGRPKGVVFERWEQALAQPIATRR
jgi:hypothetical protein